MSTKKQLEKDLIDVIQHNEILSEENMFLREELKELEIKIKEQEV